MSRLSRIVKCSAAAAVCMFTLSGCNNYSKMMKDEPQEYIKLASENTAAAMEGTAFETEKAILEKALKEGTFTFEAEADGIKMSGTGYANEKGKEFSNIFAVANESGKAEVYAALKGKEAKFGTIGNSGTHIYSIGLESLEDDFSKSLFAPGSGSGLELDASDYNTMLQTIQQVTAALNGEEAADSKEKKLEEAAARIMDENPPAVEEKIGYTIEETEVKANILTYNFNKDILKQLADVYVDAVIEEMTAQGTFDENYTAEDFKATFEETFANIETLDVKAVYYVNSKSHCLMKCDVEMDFTVEGESVSFDAVTTFGAEPTAVGKKTVEFSLTAMGQLYTAAVNYDYVSDDKTVVDIKASGQGASIDVAALTFEKADGKYTISVNIPLLTAKAVVEGALANDGKSVNFTVDKVTYTVAEAEETVDFVLKISAAQGGAYDDRAAEKGFFELTEEELNSLAENIENDFAAVLENGDYAEGSVAGDMVEYVESSRIASANANAKTVYVAFSTALTQMAIEGVECTATEFMNESDGDLNIVCNDFDFDLASYLGDGFTGYYYVSVDPASYMVNYALWSEEPLEYYYQLADYDQESLAEDGIYIGSYPLSFE